ncbi:MAG: capreomycidine synthase [Pseudonocardiaceae bacterium]
MLNEAPLLESWYREHLDFSDYDISSSGVQPYSFKEIRQITGITTQDLDEILIDDGTSFGSPDLRLAIAERYLDGSSDDVMVTHGSSEAISLVLATLCEPGPRVVVTDPVYHSLVNFPLRNGCDVQRLPVSLIENGAFADQIREIITPDTGVVIVNLPNNPTGTSLSTEGFDELIKTVADVGAYLVCDDAFSEITHSGATLPNARFRYERAITFGTFSKVFGLPGLRVGWCTADPSLLHRTLPIKDSTTLFLSPLIEKIATVAMRSADSLIAPRREQAAENLRFLDRWIAEHEEHVFWRRPDGGVCGLLSIRGLTETKQFCLDLLRTHRTMLVPGEAFDRPGHVRLGFGGNSTAFRAGLSRLSIYLRRCRS